MSRQVLFSLLFITFSGFAVATQNKTTHYDVKYRDYLGTHVVSGKRVNASTFLFNPKADKTLKLSTLEWAPYIGKNICRQGWVMQSTIALLHSIGYGAEVSFYPWARAMSTVESGKADILFPEYQIEPEAPSDVFDGTRRLDHLVLSEAFGWGPVAFIKRVDYNLSHYDKLASLINESIGVVRGYQNTPDFDRMMDMGAFKVVQATNDMNNLQLLINNRVNLIVGDPQVIIHDIKNSDKSAAEKKDLLEKIKVVEPILHMNGLYFAIAKHGQYAAKLQVELNQAIAAFKKQGVIEEIKYQLNVHCRTLKSKPEPKP
jgi:polar amino acid transport system substrate-binding protein